MYVNPSPANARRILDALEEFGFGAVGLTESDFQSSDQVVQLGRPPVRTDLITSIAGVSWELADAGKAKGLFGNVPVFYLGRKELVANRKAVGRKKDLADLEALGEQ